MGGGILTAIGGRMPPTSPSTCTARAGTRRSSSIFDAKIQTEPELVLSGYARVEEEAGVAFRFYTPEVIEIVSEARRTGLEGKELALAVEGELDTARDVGDRGAGSVPPRPPSRPLGVHDPR